MIRPFQSGGKTGTSSGEHSQNKSRHENTRRASRPMQKEKQKMLSFICFLYSMMIPAESEQISNVNKDESRTLLFY